MFTTSVRLALQALSRQPMRSLLTVVGISIGIAAVICTGALGAAGSAHVQSLIDGLGEDFLWIRAGSRNLAGVRTGYGGARTLTPADAAALVDFIPEIAACSPQTSGREQVISGGRNWNTRYQGVLPSFLDIRRRTPSRGTFFNDADVTAGARLVVLGDVVARKLFGEENPVGRTIRMGRFPFQVIGILDTRGASRGGIDRDDTVFVPLTTAMRILDRRLWVGDIMCAVQQPDLMDCAELQASALLRERHGLSESVPDDFQIQKPIDTLRTRAETTRVMSSMLAALGAVSLLVGGVGIMNIMLVAVTERRREIGVRLAIGARVRDVRLQFLAEAVAIGLLVGACGVAMGYGMSFVISRMFAWEMLVTGDLVVAAASSAVGAGVLFGYYPAHRASNLDPIEAIRAES